MTIKRDQNQARAFATRPSLSRRDGGFTFVELLVTIVLMGTVVVAILAATRTLVVASRTGREASAVESALLAAVERVERAPRKDYPCNLDGPIQAAVQLKFGLSAATVPNYVTTVYEHLEGNVWKPDACPGGLPQPNLVQRVTITVISPDNGLRRRIEVIKGDV